MPTEPPASRWALPDAQDAGDLEVAGVGADLEPGTLLAAYRGGLFPMRLPGDGRVGWWSPDPRGVLPLEGLRVSRSLRRSRQRYATTLDLAFVDVMRGCADPARPGGWIDEAFVRAYSELHDLGWAHSVEVWEDAPEGRVLVGGLYGVAIGGLFAAESKFHHARDASKVALVALVDVLRAGGATLLDVQWTTPHLASLGVVDVSREEYGERLARALTLALPPEFAGPSG
ncbi:MAG: leucyl/phenylalanyl-tRNA--protein transferase [Acidimicrobiia bacterium]